MAHRRWPGNIGHVPFLRWRLDHGSGKDWKMPLVLRFDLSGNVNGLFGIYPNALKSTPLDRLVAFRQAIVVIIDAPAVEDDAAGDRDAVGLRAHRFAVRGSQLQRPDERGPA